jgi:transposase
MSRRCSAWTMTLDISTRVTPSDFLQRRKTPVGLARRAHAMLLLEQGHSSVQTATWVRLAAYHVRKWAKRFHEHGIAGPLEKPRRGRPPICAPEVAFHLVKLACERPDQMGRALSQWDGPELARKLRADGIVQSISAATVARIFRSHKLKSWRHHLWLSADVPRDEHFAQQISDLVDLYTRPLADEEMVVCADEKTNLQPRPRLAATLPTRPGQPTRLEHGYQRASALHLFAAFDTRTGKVYARTELHKRQKEFIALLTQLDREIPPSIRRVFLVLDTSNVHKGKQAQAWLQTHPRFVCWFLPVHCSWMNHIEQWFGLVQRKRLRISDFTDLDHLAERLMAIVAEWNLIGHPFNWSTKSAAKIMAKCQAQPFLAPVA